MATGRKIQHLVFGLLILYETMIFFLGLAFSLIVCFNFLFIGHFLGKKKSMVACSWLVCLVQVPT
jgi:hypothetical protein